MNGNSRDTEGRSQKRQKTSSITEANNNPPQTASVAAAGVISDNEDSTEDAADRPSGSCETCKIRKVKCDRARPSCNWCTKNNVECIYKNRKKPGLRPGFGKELTTRLTSVEDTVVEHSDLIQQLKSQLDYLQRDFQQSKQRYQQQQTIHEAPSSSRKEQQAPIILESNSSYPDHQGDDGGDTKYPPSSMALELIDLYFQRVHAQFPILHPEETRNDLKSQVQTGSGWSTLLYSVIAISIRCLDGTRLSSSQRKQYHENCKNNVILQSLNITTVKSLQALAILAYDMVGVSNGPQTWGILALVTSAARHLGLFKEETTEIVSRTSTESISTKDDVILSPAETFLERETRRRLFWGIFLLDRYSAVATSFAFRIAENEIDRLLPTKEALWSIDTAGEPRTKWLKTEARQTDSLNETENMDQFGYLIQIIHILSLIHEFLRRPVHINSFNEVIQWQMTYRQLDREIEDWHVQLPEQIKNWPHLTPMIAMINAAYNTTVIRLHSSAGYSLIKSDFFTSSPSAARKCTEAAKNMVSLARQVSAMGNWECLGPHYAWSIWVSARLLLVDSVTTNKGAFPVDLEFLIAALKQMGNVWKVAARYWEILSLVIDEELELRGTPGSEHRRSAAILSDMRRNAYALDYLLSNKSPGDTNDDHNTNNDTGGTQQQQHNHHHHPHQQQQQQIQSSSNPDHSPESGLGYPDINGMFDFFNWPKPLDSDGAVTPMLHSLDEYKNILSKEGFELDPNQEDWLIKKT